MCSHQRPKPGTPSRMRVRKQCRSTTLRALPSSYDKHTVSTSMLQPLSAQVWRHLGARADPNGKLVREEMGTERRQLRTQKHLPNKSPEGLTSTQGPHIDLAGFREFLQIQGRSPTGPCPSANRFTNCVNRCTAGRSSPPPPPISC